MFYFYWQTIKHGMERSGKTWSGGIKRGVMKHVLPLHVLSLHVLSLHSRFYRMPLLLWRRPPQSVIIYLVVSRLYKMMPFIPQLLFFLTCDFFFLTFFLSSVTDSKCGNAFDPRQKRDGLRPRPPARQTHN